MTLDGLERLLNERFPALWDPVEKRQRNPQVRLVRYADDFIISGDSKERLEYEVRPLVERFLSERGLRLSPEKTTITHIDEGFDFLGQNVRRYGGKLLIMPSRKNVETFLKRVRAIIKSNRTVSQAVLIYQLNPVIRGWANYHRHIVAHQTYKRVDTAIWEALWQWAKRRHPNKGRRWIGEKYWHPTRLQRWAFAVDTGERSAAGKVIWLRLARATETKILRHRKIKRDANPFDPAWRAYFEERKLGKVYSPASPASPKPDTPPVVKPGSAQAEL